MSKGSLEHTKKAFQSVSKAATDAKFTHLHALALNKREGVVEYSNRQFRLVGGLESAGHQISSVKQRCTFLYGLAKEFDVTLKLS